MHACKGESAYLLYMQRLHIIVKEIDASDLKQELMHKNSLIQTR